MHRRGFLCGVGGSLLAIAASPTSLGAQPFTSVFSPARNLGDEVARLFGFGHPSQEINETYFEQIIANQEQIIRAIGNIASSIKSTAGILGLIPYQTNEIEQAIRANRVFIRSQGLLTAIGNAITQGVDPQDQGFIDAFTSLVADIDNSTASYLSAITALGQSHDLCVSVRPLWNAVQSVRDAGLITQAISPGHKALLKEAARRISDTCDSTLNGSAMAPSPFGVFRTRYDEQLQRLDNAAQILTDYRARKVVNVNYFVFSPSPDFYFGGEGVGDVLNGTVHRSSTAMVHHCDPNNMRIVERPNNIPENRNCWLVESVIWQGENPATMTRTMLSSDLPSNRLFSLGLSPQRDGAIINSHVENFNTEAAQFYHYFAVETILREVASEIDEAITTW